LAKGIELLLDDDALRGKIATNALKLAQSFSWENILKIYNSYLINTQRKEKVNLVNASINVNPIPIKEQSY
ncbi:MAG: glycosyltransferase, partial [Candidatus Kapaibacteriota bacterium]